MGVQGLEKYAEHNSRLIATTINLTKLAASRQIRLVVDGNGLMYFLYKISRLDWVLGGNYEDFFNFARDYIGKLVKAKIELDVFFDGAQNQEKAKTSVQRRERDIETVVTVCERLKRCMIPISTYSSVDLKIINPYFARKTLIDALLSCGPSVRIHQAHGEADIEIAEFCVKNHCYGVLAQDSDFLVFPHLPAYITYQSISFQSSTDGSPSKQAPTTASEDTLYVICRQFEPEKLAGSLGLPVELLPLLACIVGNDTTKHDEAALDSLHSNMGTRGKANKIDFAANFLVSQWKAGHASGKNIETWIPAKLLKGMSLRQQGKPIMMYLTLAGRITALLSNGMKKYQCKCDSSEWDSEKSTQLYKHFMECKVAPNVFNILLHKQFWCQVMVQTTNKKSISPYMLLRDLRMRMYSTLFHTTTNINSDIEVLEIVQDKRSLARNMLTVHPKPALPFFELLGFPHPIENAWDSPSILFCCACNLMLVASSKYILEWELDALILFYVMINQEKNYLTLPNDDRLSIYERSVDIGAYYQTALDHVQLANQLCGMLYGDFHPVKYYSGSKWAYLYGCIAQTHQGKDFNLGAHAMDVFGLPSSAVETWAKLKQVIVGGRDNASLFPTKKQSMGSPTISNASPNNPFSVLSTE